MLLDGPSVLIGMAAKFGFLSPEKALLIGGLQAAAKPQKKELSNDWIQNLDVMAGALGCIVAGVFDNLVAPYRGEDLSDLDPEPLVDQFNLPPMVRSALLGCYDVAVQLYNEYGPLSPAIEAGKFLPEGLVTAGVLKPFTENAPVNSTTKSDGLLTRKSVTENQKLAEKNSLVV